MGIEKLLNGARGKNLNKTAAGSFNWIERQRVTYCVDNLSPKDRDTADHRHTQR